MTDKLISMIRSEDANMRVLGVMTILRQNRGLKLLREFLERDGDNIITDGGDYTILSKQVRVAHYDAKVKYIHLWGQYYVYIGGILLIFKLTKGADNHWIRGMALTTIELYDK